MEIKYASPLCAPFFMQGGKEGILFIHGFAGAPALYRIIGRRMNEKGYTVSSILLPGHGTRPEDLVKVTPADWIKASKDGAEELLKKCNRIHIVGLSLGGALATIIAGIYGGDDRIASVCLLSAAYAFNNPAFYKLEFDKPYNTFPMIVDKKGDAELEEISYGYPYMPFGGIKHLIEMFDEVKDYPERITAPTLMLWTAADPVASPEAIDEVSRRIKTVAEKHCYEKSEHNLLIGCDRQDVNNRVEKFVIAHTI
jgi:carboxylesterase